jgi:hypothetical protein
MLKQAGAAMIGGRKWRESAKLILGLFVAMILLWLLIGNDLITSAKFAAGFSVGMGLLHFISVSIAMWYRNR